MEWDDEDGFGPMMTPEDSIKEANKNSRVVVLKHMFTLKDLDDDPTLLLDLREDVREECSTLGEVTNVVLYDVCDVHHPQALFFIDCISLLQKEPDGVMTVKFRDPISARACIIVSGKSNPRVHLIISWLSRKWKEDSLTGVGSRQHFTQARRDFSAAGPPMTSSALATRLKRNDSTTLHIGF